jgi:hypothetical protein
VDPIGLWYIDFNFNIGLLGGVTFGIMVNDKGAYPYVGGGLMTLGVAVTWSPHEPARRKTVALQAGYWMGGQIGDLTSESENEYWEVGFVTPGISLIAYHVFENLYDVSRNRLNGADGQVVRLPIPPRPREIPHAPIQVRVGQASIIDLAKSQAKCE